MTSRLRSIISELELSCAVSNKQQEIKTVLQVYVNANSQRSDQEIIKDIKRYPSVQLLYSKENLNEPIVLFRLLRAYLIQKSFRSISKLSCSRIMFCFVKFFCESEDDETYAKQKLASMKTPGLTATSLHENTL